MRGGRARKRRLNEFRMRVVAIHGGTESADRFPNPGGGYSQGTVSVIEPRENFSLLHQLIYYRRRVI